jgi:hypothetical protein
MHYPAAWRTTLNATPRRGASAPAGGWAALSLSPPRLDEQKTGLVGMRRPVHTIVRMGQQTLFPKSGFDERALLGDIGQECQGKHAPGFGKHEQVVRCQPLNGGPIALPLSRGSAKNMFNSQSISSSDSLKRQARQ